LYRGTQLHMENRNSDSYPGLHQHMPGPNLSLPSNWSDK